MGIFDININGSETLKPNNPRQIKAGYKQLENYQKLFQQQYGGSWKTVLDTY